MILIVTNFHCYNQIKSKTELILPLSSKDSITTMSLLIGCTDDIDFFDKSLFFVLELVIYYVIIIIIL